jgi:hypothetical protein
MALASFEVDPTVKVVALEGYWESGFDSDGLNQFIGLGREPRPVRDDSVDRMLLDVSLRETLKSLQGANKKVVVFNDVPTYSEFPLWHMRTGQNAIRTALWRGITGAKGEVDPGYAKVSDSNPAESSARRLIFEVSNSVSGVKFWNLRKGLCLNEEICRYRDGANVYYGDDTHLTALGSEAALGEWSPGLHLTKP